VNWVDKLLNHERFKTAAGMLESRRVLEEGMWTQPGTSQVALPAEGRDSPANVASPFDIIRVFGDLLERVKKPPDIQMHRKRVTVAQMSNHIRRVLVQRV
jgi:segregation and condensation protein A